jgi:pimeloyl-ACP methyl ester carboxylesterase
MDILVLHGWGQNAALFEQLKKQIETIEGVDRVITLDLPGFGNTSLVNSNWGIPEYADWVNREIVQRKLKNVVIIGHSFGGRITAFLASQRPSYLKAIVLSGSPVLYRPARNTKVKNNFSRIIKKVIPFSAKSVMYSQELADAEKNGLGDVFRKVVVFDQTDALKKISVPSLLLWGAEDYDAPLTIAKEAQQLIPNSELSIIPKAGHNSFHSHPYIFFSHVKKFIETL